jgi:hypothetical protein
MCDFVRAGYLVSIPFGENHRYDLIIEKDFVLSRVQVKTGRLRKGVVIFNCFSSHTHRGGVATPLYKGEVEYAARGAGEERSDKGPTLGAGLYFR